MPREEREATIRRKMQYLIDNGHEICNHTMWHARLDKYDDAFVQDQIGSGEDSIRAYLPADYDIVTFALPLGQWPKNRMLASRGSYREGKSYENRAILEVTGGPNPLSLQRSLGILTRSTASSLPRTIWSGSWTPTSDTPRSGSSRMVIHRRCHTRIVWKPSLHETGWIAVHLGPYPPVGRCRNRFVPADFGSVQSKRPAAIVPAGLLQ